MMVVLIILFCIASLGCGFFFKKFQQLTKQKAKVVSINEQVFKELKSLEKEIKEKRSDLASIKESVETQSNIVKSLRETTKQMQEQAETRAEECYKARTSALESQYQEKERELKKQLKLITDKTAQEDKKLKDLEDKQKAYFEAQQREKEKEANEDYYRLALSNNDIKEVEILRNIQLQFTHKEAIDKLIWEVYYKPAYDLLMNRLFGNKTKVCGIYRITNLINNMAYIGQSVDARERARQHIKSGLSYTRATNKLYQQMQDHGVHNFTFELLEEVSRDKLNEREAYWIKFYNTATYGLNSTKGNNV